MQIRTKRKRKGGGLEARIEVLFPALLMRNRGLDGPSLTVEVGGSLGRGVSLKSHYGAVRACLDSMGIHEEVQYPGKKVKGGFLEVLYPGKKVKGGFLFETIVRLGLPSCELPEGSNAGQ